MTSTAGKNRPKKGSFIKAEPIRGRDAIERIKAQLEPKPRDYCLFVLGINTAFRACELRSLTCGQVAHLGVGDELPVWQTKTKKWRVVALNNSAVSATRRWLKVHPNPSKNAPLFQSRVGNALIVPTISTMVKTWCRAISLEGNYGSHSLRKTWGYHLLRRETDLPKHMVLPVLMRAFGHARQEQTLDYLCIQSDEIANLYLTMNL